MAKKWSEFTRREKVIGGIAAVAAVFIIGGAANGIGGNSSQSPASTPAVIGPVVTTKVVTETEPIAFGKSTREDSSKPKGETAVTTPGVQGERTKSYEATITDGVETGRVLKKDEVTKQPVTEVTTVGTYVAPAKKQSASCDPNYSGGCVPIASDVDCGGGKGNGPAYFYGTATVTGSDIYKLDGDNDGIACE